jgi:hypothetical protein
VLACRALARWLGWPKLEHAVRGVWGSQGACRGQLGPRIPSRRVNACVSADVCLVCVFSVYMSLCICVCVFEGGFTLWVYGCGCLRVCVCALAPRDDLGFGDGSIFSALQMFLSP